MNVPGQLGRSDLKRCCFACGSFVASEANDVSVYSARVAFGVFIPRQDRRAVPPEGCFALTCFLLVTFLDSGHPALRRCAASSAVRAAPAAQCTSKEKLPAGRRTAEALAVESNPLGLRPSGSPALVAGEGNRLLR